MRVLFRMSLVPRHPAALLFELFFLTKFVEQEQYASLFESHSVSPIKAVNIATQIHRTDKPIQTVNLLDACLPKAQFLIFFFLFSFQVVRYGFPFRPVAVAFDPVQKLVAIGTKTGHIRM